MNLLRAPGAAVLAAPGDARYLYGRMPQASIKADLRAVVGEQGMLEGAAVRERAATLFHGRVESDLLVRPRSTGQVSAILRACHERGQSVVVHGGLTGLVNGADAEAGLGEDTLRAFRDTRDGENALEGSEERLRGFGVRTVPNLLFGGRVLVPGTVNVDTYVHALDQALFPSSEEEAQEKPTLQ